VQKQAYIDIFLGVSKKHPLGAASGDTIWMPSKCIHQLNMTKFRIHLLQMDNERMVKKVYNECKSLTDS